jgi:hypothetical protein
MWIRPEVAPPDWLVHVRYERRSTFIYHLPACSAVARSPCESDNWNLCILLEHYLCIFITHLMLNLAISMHIICDYWFPFIFIRVLHN